MSKQHRENLACRVRKKGLFCEQLLAPCYYRALRRLEPRPMSGRTVERRLMAIETEVNT